MEATEVAEKIREVVEEQHEQHAERSRYGRTRSSRRLPERRRDPDRRAGVAARDRQPRRRGGVRSSADRLQTPDRRQLRILSGQEHPTEPLPDRRRRPAGHGAAAGRRDGARGAASLPEADRRVPGHDRALRERAGQEVPDDPIKGEGKKELLARGQYWEAQRNEAQLKFPNFHYAEALFQVAIVLGSVTLITRRRWMILWTLGLGAVGIVMMLNGFFLLVELPGSH